MRSSLTVSKKLSTLMLSVLLGFYGSTALAQKQTNTLQHPLQQQQ